MAKYISLRPIISNLPNFSRKFKFAAAIILLIVVTCILVFRNSRHSRLSKIYNSQAIIADTYDLEMKYIDTRPSSDEDSWLSAVDLDGHVYSAYLDLRPEIIDHYSYDNSVIAWSLVRIIAILPTRINDKTVECVFKYPNEIYGYANERRPARSDNVHDISQLPESVAIGLPKVEKLNFVDVHYPTMGMGQLSQPAYNFMAVCVPVFHHSFDRPLDLVEFIEYYLQLGATHLTFYNSSITPDVSRVLEYYKKREFATVLKWQLPAKYIFEKTLRHEGLFAGLNDCLYRNAFHENYEYIGIFGIDDFLVPRKHDNFANLMEHLDPHHSDMNGRYSSFVFRNRFFYTMYENDRDNKDPKAPYLYTQAKTWGLEKPNEPGDRSRYIVRGRDVVELGNYRVVELREGSSTFAKPFEEMAVKPEVAISHQYAPCEAEETGCYLKPLVIDKTAHRFTRQLGMRVASACNDIFGAAGCPFVNKQTLA